uniref:Uncharacterized protein n=2 Tax=Cacopsylla melanoneura TaxID=428564 RepID=A0A8D8TTU3_9HEMI
MFHLELKFLKMVPSPSNLHMPSNHSSHSPSLSLFPLCLRLIRWKRSCVGKGWLNPTRSSNQETRKFMKIPCKNERRKGKSVPRERAKPFPSPFNVRLIFILPNKELYIISWR